MSKRSWEPYKGTIYGSVKSYPQQYKPRKAMEYTSKIQEYKPKEYKPPNPFYAQAFWIKRKTAIRKPVKEPSKSSKKITHKESNDKTKERPRKDNLNLDNQTSKKEEIQKSQKENEMDRPKDTENQIQRSDKDTNKVQWSHEEKVGVNGNNMDKNGRPGDVRPIKMYNDHITVRLASEKAIENVLPRTLKSSFYDKVSSSAKKEVDKDEDNDNDDILLL